MTKDQTSKTFLNSVHGNNENILKKFYIFTIDSLKRLMTFILKVVSLLLINSNVKKLLLKTYFNLLNLNSRKSNLYDKFHDK